jgi:3',5'-cyclic AMP phosphodiesterase CpdA
MRILHFSDVHVQVPVSQIPVADLIGKRLLGAANLVLRRERLFREAPQKLSALAHLAHAAGVDLVICTGDYTALGTEPELIAARSAVDALTRAPLGFATVPGNHDVYVPDAIADRRFERHFGDLLRTDRPDLTVDGTWPIVRMCGPLVAVVAVNSARPNPHPFRSSGAIPVEQISALERILALPEIAERFVFVITHYAPRRKDGTPDTAHHGLDNADDLLRVCTGVHRGALLHGHIHWRYHLQLPGGALPIFGAGSATHAGREGFWVFDIEADRALAIAGYWDTDRYVLDTERTIELPRR